MMQRFKSGWWAAGALGLIAAAAGPAAAQNDGSGWNAWLGCWEPVLLDPTAVVEAPESALCVLPGDRAAQVVVVTLEDGLVVGRETLDASGAERPREVDGCAGVETVAWSNDGKRLFQTSRLECDGLERHTSGILSINPAGEWVSVDAVTVAGNTDVRAVRYRHAPEVERNNREVAAALEGRAMAIDAARTAVSARADLPDVIEAGRRIEVPAVEAWLIEQGHGYDVDAAQLRQLALADVAEPVIDLVVALSYPDVFAIDRSARSGEPREGDGGSTRRPRSGPWYYPMYGGYYPGYWGGYYGRPVIVVRDPDIDVDRGGRAVNGRGYTRGGRGSDTGTPSGPSTSTGRSLGGGSSGTDTGRTAKPR